MYINMFFEMIEFQYVNDKHIHVLTINLAH